MWKKLEISNENSIHIDHDREENEIELILENKGNLINAWVMYGYWLSLLTLLQTLL